MARRYIRDRSGRFAGGGVTYGNRSDRNSDRRWAKRETAKLNKEQKALEAMRTGAGTVQTWQDLVDMNNICQTMARSGIGVEALPDCMMAEIELKHAVKRYEATGKMLLTGTGLRAIGEVLEWHHLQRTAISRSKYERMIEKTRNKIISKSAEVHAIS